MDKVYIVEGGFRYEGAEVLGVYADRAAAEKHGATVDSEYDYVDVNEYEVK